MLFSWARPMAQLDVLDVDIERPQNASHTHAPPGASLQQPLALLTSRLQAKAEAGVVPKLRCLLLKLSSVLAQPLLRLQQQSLPGLQASRASLSRQLEGFAVRLLQVPGPHTLPLCHATVAFVGLQLPPAQCTGPLTYAPAALVCVRAQPCEHCTRGRELCREQALHQPAPAGGVEPGLPAGGPRHSDTHPGDSCRPAGAGLAPAAAQRAGGLPAPACPPC